MDKTKLARIFAHLAHDSIGQKRKYTGEPYWVHTDEVAAILMVQNIHEPEIIQAAHLHDVLEDVYPKNRDVNYDAIREVFGVTVAQLVYALTDVFTPEAYPHLNRAERKHAERNRIASITIPAKDIKLADLISNTRSIVEHASGFAKTYLEEKASLLEVLKNANPDLLRIAQNQLEIGRLLLKTKELTSNWK